MNKQTIKKFTNDELEVAGISEINARMGAHIPVYTYPFSQKLAWKSAILDKQPVWLNTGSETFAFFAQVIPDNKARGFCTDSVMRLEDHEKGGLDMFGVDWIFVPIAGGSMENPDDPPLLSDVNEWPEKLIWPDIDSWDWGGCAQRNKEMLDHDLFTNMPLMNGCFFERLISFMGFENAAVALIDEDQTEALKALFEKMADLFCDIVDRCCEHFNVDGFLFHDDWGAQNGPFFTFETGAEIFVPAMRKLTDHIHAKGKVAELHSCGKCESQIENFIAAGWDVWRPMANINDTKALFEQYGDRIVIGVSPEGYGEGASEKEQRELAAKTVESLCGIPGKACVLNPTFTPFVKGPYAEELYKQSRILLAK